MNELVGEHQISNSVDVTLNTEILVVRTAEASVYAMVMVHHAGNSVESEAVNLKLFYVVGKIAQQES